jgi:hypothetical protein
MRDQAVQMNESRIPAALFDAVKRDLQPVRPLASPERRALALLPIAIMLLVGLPEFWNWRTHSPLAPWPSWILSALETAVSLAILAAGFHEAVPGRELSRRALAALMCTAATGFVLVNTTTQVPTGFSPAWMRWFWECIETATTFSIPALIAPAWLVSRALPNRPALTGALCGLAVGLMGDAGLRLFCWDGDYAHVLVAHGGAILLLVALGALSATIVERVKARLLRRTSRC